MLEVSALVVSSGVASKLWIEWYSLPPGFNNRLWLLVGSTWTQHADTCSAVLLESVQNAFNAGSNLEVAVWWDTANNNIVGLVVRTP
jgi:hypothetical protein